MDVEYRPIGPADYPAVTELIFQLYQEDPAQEPMMAAKIERTLLELAAHPDKGTIVAIRLAGQMIGYSILINFWSNERGGNLLTVDELYVSPEFRGKGVGTNFIRYLIQSRLHDAVGLQLEVTPRNARAKRLYETLGFSVHKNETLYLKL